MSTIDQDDINAGSRVITSYVSTVSPNRDEILDTTDTIVRLHGAAGITVGKCYYTLPEPKSHGSMILSSLTCISLVKNLLSGIQYLVFGTSEF